MILFDTNILIYSAKPQYKYLRELFKQKAAGASTISKLEVLGYHKIAKEQSDYFNAVFFLVNIIPITDNIVEQAIYYRQAKSMSVADALIAATAKLYNCILYTNNIEDFKSIKDFQIENPLI